MGGCGYGHCPWGLQLDTLVNTWDLLLSFCVLKTAFSPQDVGTALEVNHAILLIQNSSQMTVERNYKLHDGDCYAQRLAETPRQFFNQLEAKPNLIAPYRHDFSRALSKLHCETFWLVHRAVSSCCDWSELSVWYWFFENRSLYFFSGEKTFTEKLKLASIYRSLEPVLNSWDLLHSYTFRCCFHINAPIDNKSMKIDTKITWQ